MLKFFLRMIWVLLPMATYLSIIYIGQQGFNIETEKNRKFARIGTVTGILIAFALMLVKVFTVWLNKEFLTIFVNSGAIFGEVFCLILLLIISRKNATVLAKNCLAVTLGWLNLFAILLTVPDVFIVFYQIYIKGEDFFTTNSLFKFIGCILAIFLVAVVYSCWIKLAKILSNRERIAILVFFFILQIAIQIPTILQPLLARRLIPFYPWLFKYIVFMNNNAQAFQLVFFAINVVLSIYFMIKIKRLPVEGINSAEIRKKKVKKRYYNYCFIGFILSAIFLVFSVQYGEAHLSQSTELAPAEEKIIKGDKILIPLAQVSDGHLHRFEHLTPENVKMRFIVVLKNESSYGVGLDACDICGATGYYERNDEIVCKLCDVVMNRSTIGFKGGCNPVPLAYTIENNQMVINQADLNAEQVRFE